MTSSPITLSRADKRLILHALVVKDLDVDVLVGTPFMISSDISVSSAKGQVLIQGSNVVSYHSETLTSPQRCSIQRMPCLLPHNFGLIEGIMGWYKSLLSETSSSVKHSLNLVPLSNILWT